MATITNALIVCFVQVFLKKDHVYIQGGKRLYFNSAEIILFSFKTNMHVMPTLTTKYQMIFSVNAFENF